MSRAQAIVALVDARGDRWSAQPTEAAHYGGHAFATTVGPQFCAIVDGSTSTRHSRIPVWLMTRLEDADENRRAAEIRTLGVNDKHGRTGRLPRGRRR